jgi:hypothetical protein
MTENLVEIDVLSLLQFFDEAVPASRYHATAVVAVAGEDMGVGLIAHYLRQQGLTVEVLPGPCTQGTHRGVRLDRWIRTIHDGNAIYYQVEIKNWSAHAIGGKALKANALPNELAAHKIERWSREWDGSTFRKSGARKVLTPMKPPKPNSKVEPLIVYWDAMHPSGEREPFFFVPLENPAFSRVWIFSMSTYLRELLSSGISKVMLEMPDTVQRVWWLKRLFMIL